MTTAFSSPQQKQEIRRTFDYSLIKHFIEESNGGQRVNYFGLSGPRAEDLFDWDGLIAKVTSVDFRDSDVGDFENTVRDNLPSMDPVGIHGYIDDVIISDHGSKDGRTPPPIRISNNMDPILGNSYWDFQLVNLDYYGELLWNSGPDPTFRRESAKKRIQAWRSLFETQRVDAHGSWLMFITVEATQDEFIWRACKSGFNAAKQAWKDQLGGTLDELLSLDPSTDIEASARVLQAIVGLVLSQQASAAKLWCFAQYSVIYEGNSGTPMIHMAFEFKTQPDLIFPVPVTPIAAVRAPLFSAPEDSGAQFTLMSEHDPDDVRSVFIPYVSDDVWTT